MQLKGRCIYLVQPRDIDGECVCMRVDRFGQHVLWPTKPAPEPRPCEQCGGPRRLELQLMPGLMHALDEGLAWQAEHGAGQGPTIDDWNWLSIAVFTCAKSCSDGRGGVSVMQEQVDICLE